MNKKQLITSIIVLVILGLITFFTLKKDSTSWEQGDEFQKRKLVDKLEVNKVSEFTITTASEKLELKKDDNGKWIVANRDSYPANFSKISNFLMRLKDITVVQEPRLLAEQFASLKLNPPVKDAKPETTGSLLELKDKDGKTLLTMLVGQQHFPDKPANSFEAPKPDGCYLIINGSKKPALISNAMTVIDPDPRKWLKPDFIKIPDILSIALSGSDGKQIYRISRENRRSAWILDGLVKGDVPLPRPMREITSAFEKISFDDVSSAKDIELKDAKTLNIKTERGIEYIIKLLPKDKKVYAKIGLTGNLRSEKMPLKDAVPENMEETKKKLEARAKALQKLLEKESFYMAWLYEFPIYKMKKVLKDREELYRPNL